jgi:hypothetical protein
MEILRDILSVIANRASIPSHYPEISPNRWHNTRVMVIMTKHYPVNTPVSSRRIKPELEPGLCDWWNSSVNMMSRFNTPSSREFYHQTSFQCRSIWSERTELTMLGIIRDLADLSRQSLIVINPVVGGTGQGIKTIEARSLRNRS